MKLNDLSPNPQNPRKITDDKLKMLKASLDNFGDLSGIVFNRTSQTLSGGHQRVKCLPPDAEIVITSQYAEKNKQGTVAVGFVFIDGERYSYREVEWDELTEKAANLAANTHGGEWDNKQRIEWLLELEANNYPIEITGLDKEEQEDLMAPFRTMPEGLTDADATPEVRETSIRLGDLFSLGEHRLLCGDSTQLEQVLRLMNGEKADMVFTDPPYNIAEKTTGIASSAPTNKQNKKLMDSEWDKGFVFSSVSESLNQMASNDSTVYVCSASFTANEIWLWLEKAFDFYSYCVWSKPNPFPSLSKRHWVQSTELVSYGTRGKYIFNYPETGNALSVWEFPIGEGGLHPTQKPVKIPEHAILHSSKPGMVVGDLFLGSGSTLIACEKTNRKCYGMEIDPQYVQVVIDRWEQFTGKKAVKL